VYSIALGQNLRYEKDMLTELALGGLLLDIGKIAVPVPILAKPGALSSTERVMAQAHVDSGFELIQANGLASGRVSEMVLGHHERLDGSGYPQRTVGTEIPICARIAAIVDTFDALTVDRPYAMSLSPADGLRRLDEDRGLKFDGALVNQFLSALGSYPTGTWVKLADGSVGIVCVQSPDEPRRPRIAIILDPDDQPLVSLQWFEPSDPTEIAETLSPASQPTDASRLERTLQVGMYPG
jgi:HD-GYP domain-containing protein (c-di-GMP phosphodiesterase class II)